MVIDEAILQLYHTGRSNGNSLTLGGHRLLADWTTAMPTACNVKSGVNWQVAGLGSGSDYTAAAAATASLTGAGNAWVDLNITALAQAWINNPASNLGLALTQEAASGYVVYDFCSELGWSPCTPPCPGAPPAACATTWRRLRRSRPPSSRAAPATGASTPPTSTAARPATTTPAVGISAREQHEGAAALQHREHSRRATVDQATLQLYQTSRSNGNTLTLAAHQVLADWVDAQASRLQRKTGVSWQAPGMGSGSDYLAAADGTAALASEGGVWVDLDVTAMAQAWVASPASNYGLVLLQAAASGSVYYSFCTELGLSPCTLDQGPQLTIWYRP